MTENSLGRSRPQHVGVADVAAARDDRMHHRQDLAARAEAAHPAGQADRGVDQRLEIETGGHRGGQHQPGVRHQRLVVEVHPHAVQTVRYSTH